MENSSFDIEWKLMKLCQTTSVLNYQVEFEFLSRRVTKMSELLLINFFISGLKPEIRGELQLNRPKSLKEAFTCALFHGSRLEGSKFEMNKVDDELTNSELDGKDTIVEMEIVETLVTEVEYEIHVPTINSMLQVEVADEEPTEESIHEQADEDAKTLLPEGLEIEDDILEQEKLTFDLIRSVVVVGCDAKIEFQAFPTHHSKEEHKVVTKDIQQCLVRGGIVSKRRMVLKFYTLKEIYRDVYLLHLEDKVILKR